MLETIKLENLPVVEAGSAPPLEAALPNPAVAQCDSGSFRLQRVRLTDGLRAGVDVIIVESDNVRAAICPTRGMSLWKAHIDGVNYGWNSPVAGPIHPNFVAINEPSGIGWLDGFDELLARCGMRSFGAPDFDDAGRVKFPVHGRVGNLPAQNVQVRIDPQLSQLHVSGEVLETRFLQYNLQLHVDYVFKLGAPLIEVHDRVTNAGGTPTTMQMLYHINIGKPLLAAGCQLHLAANQVVARDSRAAENLSDWQTYQAPTPGFAEQVYFSQATPSGDGWAKALLAAQDAQCGFAVHYRPTTLPFFSAWKNTAAEADGYVTGLEPGTGFPNPRSFEESKGRLVELAAGESRSFQLRLEGIQSPERISQLKSELATTRGSDTSEAVEFHPDWCLPR